MSERKSPHGVVIGVVGKAGSGKDTVARLIPNSKRFSFADPLKEFCGKLFGWSKEQLWGSSELRNAHDSRFPREHGPWVPKGLCDLGCCSGQCSCCGVRTHDQNLYRCFLTPRFALQTLGTEWGRNCSEDIWAQYGVRRAQEWFKDATSKPPFMSAGPVVAVFPDCRFVNEAKAIRDAGGQVWRIDRPGSGLAGAAGTHPSEMEQESPEMEELITCTIHNRTTLEDLEKRVQLALAGLL